MATAALTASGCSTGVSPVGTVTSTTAETVAATAGREGVRVVDQDAGDVVLGVSNQSFDDPDVGLKVMVDDVMVVDGSFAVEGQHTVVFLGLDLEPGTHTLGAVSDSGASASTTFELPAGERRWISVYYWYLDPDHEGVTWGGEDEEPGPRVDVHVSDEPLRIA